MSAIKFEDFNFEIIDIDLPGRPYMLIGKNTLSFSKVVAERMNYPAQILAYFDHSTQTFAIKGCKVGAHSSIRFSKDTLAFAQYSFFVCEKSNLQCKSFA